MHDDLPNVQWVPLGLSPYQRCCIVGCDRDAVTQFKACIKGITYYISSCGSEVHIRDLLIVIDSIKKHYKLTKTDKEVLQLNFVMVQPHDQLKKCRYDLWVAQRDTLNIVNKSFSEYVTKKTKAPPALIKPVELVEPIKPTEPKEQLATPKKPIDEWVFFDISAKNMRQSWMNLEHKKCSVFDLTDMEFVDAVISIYELNYKRIPKSLKWIYLMRIKASEIFQITTHYMRYTKELSVGTVKAAKKLEVFKESAILRGFIGG